jgi:hypothetical protein
MAGRNRPQMIARGKDLIENRLDQEGEPDRRNGVDHHRQHRPGQAALIRFRVAKEAI